MQFFKKSLLLGLATALLFSCVSSSAPGPTTKASFHAQSGHYQAVSEATPSNDPILAGWTAVRMHWASLQGQMDQQVRPQQAAWYSLPVTLPTSPALAVWQRYVDAIPYSTDPDPVPLNEPGRLGTGWLHPGELPHKIPIPRQPIGGQ